MREKRLKFSYFLVFFSVHYGGFDWSLAVQCQRHIGQSRMPVPYTERQFIQLVAKEVKPLAKNYGIRPSILIVSDYF
ncbi:hypothetical protein [Streptococcus equi]|uniref:hypothetical protein n=1 Tax=Streptococcus equi TaxID=1336 RepID=UPI001E658999|nr:hypothetical protein [Streptococcus equi]